MEYGIAVIITSINRFHDYLRSRISSAEPVTQFEYQEDNDSQNEVVNGAEDDQEIKLEEEKISENCANCTEEIKVIKQEMREMKNGMDNLFEMIRNVMSSNNEGKIKSRSRKIKKVNSCR